MKRANQRLHRTPAKRLSWQSNIIGPGSVNPTPVRRDHLTDWNTTLTSKGLALKLGEFKPAAIRVSGDIASVCYRITYQLLDKEGDTQTYTSRITHAWIRNGSDWRIISGMSMREPPRAAK